MDIYTPWDHSAIEASTDLALARQAADDLLLMLPLTLGESASRALPDCLQLAINFFEHDVDEAIHAIHAVADDLAAARDRVASLGGLIETSMAVALAEVARATTYPLNSPFWGPVWEAVMACLPAPMRELDLSAYGHGILLQINRLTAVSGFQAWLTRDEEPTVARAMRGIVPGMSEYLDALDGSDDLHDALGQALPQLPALRQRINVLVDFDRDRVNAELDLEFARAAAKRPRDKDRTVPRLRTNLGDNTVVLDGRRFAEVDADALHALDALWRATIAGDTPISRKRLRGQYLPNCHHDRTLSRWFARLPEELRGLIAGKEGRGIHLALPAKG